MRRARYPAARWEDLPLLEGRWVRLGEGGGCVLVRTPDKVFAVGSLCPHQNAPLDGAPVQDNAIICRRHGYRFDLATGECRTLGGYAIPTFSTDIEAEIVYVTLWEFD